MMEFQAPAQNPLIMERFLEQDILELMGRPEELANLAKVVVAVERPRARRIVLAQVAAAVELEDAAAVEAPEARPAGRALR